MPSFTLPYQDPFGTGTRPYLTIHLVGINGQEGDVTGLIDSGADTTAMPVGFAPLMGYTPSTLTHSQGTQAGGVMDIWNATEPVQAWILGLPQHPFEFFPAFVEGDQTLWGRADFFKAFTVGFDELAATFSFSPR